MRLQNELTGQFLRIALRQGNCTFYVQILFINFGFLHGFLVKTGLVIVPFAQIHLVVVIRIDSHSRGAVLRQQIA